MAELVSRLFYPGINSRVNTPRQNRAARGAFPCDFSGRGLALGAIVAS